MCELDPDLVEVAEKWFRFERARGEEGGGGGGGINVHIEDGVSFLKKNAACLKEKKKKGEFKMQSLLQPC